jgi:hypothetical protein
MVAHNATVCYILASVLWDHFFGHECNCLSGGGESSDLLSKGFAPDVFVLWMLEEVAVFQEISSFFVKNGRCEVSDETHWVSACGSLLIGEGLCDAGHVHHVKQVVLCEGADLALKTSVGRGRGVNDVVIIL